MIIIIVNLKSIPNNYIALPIGAGRKTKALTIEKIIHICQGIKYPVILLGGKQEVEKAAYIQAIINATEGKEKLFSSDEKKTIKNNITTHSYAVWLKHVLWEGTLIIRTTTRRAKSKWRATEHVIDSLKLYKWSFWALRV